MNEGSLKISHIEPTEEGILLRFTGAYADFLELVAELKTRFREGIRWTPAAFDGKGGWLLPLAQFLQRRSLFSNWDDILQSLKEQVKEEQNTLTVEQAFICLHLRSTASLSIIKAVYRVLAQEAHPDHGGTHDQMVTLNKAYELAQLHVGGGKR